MIMTTSPNSGSGATTEQGPTLAVTGVTGALGGMVSRALAKAGVPQRMLARTPSKASGVAYTFLRDNFYQDLLPYFVGEDGMLRGPAGHGRAAYVARADVARVAAVVLQDPGAHAGGAYDLTGPEALTLYDVATLLTKGLRRSVSYVDETVPEAYESRAHYGAPDWQVDAWVSTYTAIRAGELERVSDDSERITGRPATSLAQLLVRAGA